MNLKDNNLSTKGDNAFTKKGFVNWKKAIEKFKTHEKSDMHKFSMESKLKKNEVGVIQMISTKENKNMKNNRRCLHIIFTTMKVCYLLFLILIIC